MTRKQIIEQLEYLIEIYSDFMEIEIIDDNPYSYLLDADDMNAIEMAIKELKKDAVLDKIRAEVTAIDINGQVDEHTMFIRTGEQVKQMVLGIIDKYTAEESGGENT